jgi:type I restriction enzyme S subunit
MIEGLKPYSQYKQTGSTWLGAIPSHWEEVPLGRVLVQRIEQNRPVKTTEILSLSLRQGVIPYSEKKSGGNKAKSDLSAYTLAYPGDIVLNSMNVVVGSVGLSKYYGAVSPVYYVLHTRKRMDLIQYFDAIFQDKSFQQSLWGLGNGIMFLQSKTTGKFNTIRLRIPMSKLRRVIVTLPPPDEQAAIVKFLDYANGKIERAIRAKRKLIGLLNEQKQAIIHHAVTRGLDPNVKLKPSGIPWLGDVPEHWEIKRIKYLMNTVDCRSATGDEVLLSMRKYHGLVPYHEHFHKPPQAATLKGFKLVKPGQIVVNRMQAGFGLISSSTYDGLVSPDFGVFQPTGEVVPEFLGELFRSREVRAQFQRESKGLGTGQSGFMRLYDDRIGIVHIAFPPFVDEQHMILSHLKDDVRGVENTIRITEREIALLLEYRTTLTAEVVTGKLDVREAVKRLPNQGDEPLPADESLDDLVDDGVTEEDEA